MTCHEVRGVRESILLVVLLAVSGCNTGGDLGSGVDVVPGDVLLFGPDIVQEVSATDGPVGELEDTWPDAEPDMLLDASAEVPGDIPLDTPADASADTSVDIPSEICTPDCDEKACGDDGCGGSCGGCDDGDLCNGSETCEDGQCVEGTPPACDDGNPCTDDDCGPLSGCASTPNTAPCDDGNECTDGDACAGGDCVGGASVCACMTGDDCPEWVAPADLCKGKLICANDVVPYVCEVDPATVVTCDVGLDTQCTQQVCVPATGLCEEGPANEGGPCDDGVPCSGPDTCQGGVCSGSSAGCEEFSVVLLPDTQYYTNKQTAGPANTYYKQTQWIVDHEIEHDIKFVIHLGDITHNNTVAEWQVADGAHAILDAAGIPYSMVTGNHDYAPLSSFSRDQTKLNDYFGPDRFQGETWYGGSYGGKNDSNYTFFEAGGREFMVLSVEHAPRKDVLCWAGDLIASHPQRRVIIVTHCYLTHGGVYSMSCADGYDTPGSSGLTVWEELASRHSNVSMVLCGHVGDSEYVPVQGNAGNTVHQMLVDYQFEAPCTGGACNNSCSAGIYTGNGWMRRLVFAPAENQVHVETWSVEAGNSTVFPQGDPAFFCTNQYDQDPAGPDHAFSYDYDLTSPQTPYQYVPPESGAFNDRTVNSAAAGDQLKPRVAMNANGDIVIAWEDNASGADGSGNHDILARGFLPGGCEGFDDIVTNDALTAGHQDSPDLAMDSAGGFVVTWRDDNDGNGVGQIHARGFDSDGGEVFSVVPVNSIASGEQRHPAVAMATNGAFVVVWEDNSDGADGSGNYDIHARGFHASGAEKIVDLVVNQDTAGQQRLPAVALASNGDFVVTWEDDKDDNGLFQIYARGFHADGTQKFAAMTVNSVSAGQQLAPTVAMDSAGNFVIAWEDDSSSADGSGNYDIHARGFDANGGELFGDLMVNAAPGGQQLAPAIALRPDGAFVVVWEDDSDGNGKFQIYARGFTSGGAQAFPEMTVNSESVGQQLTPAVAVHAAGVFVIAWQDDMDENGVGQIMARGLDW